MSRGPQAVALNVVRRERTTRVETVRDTIRRDEVEISNASGRSGNRRAALAYSRK
ncbi:hypothetical protein [Methylobacterium nigriterrae]|uniref:hypothetical protein n=1 Tax=Methylobacterium nigriterrae TaxID=3127512 RepID=UPI00301401DE